MSKITVGEVQAMLECGLFGVADMLKGHRLFTAGLDNHMKHSVHLLQPDVHGKHSLQPLYIPKAGSQHAKGEYEASDGHNIIFPMPKSHINSVLSMPGYLHDISYPSVPRTGNTWVRSMIDVASGLAVECVFPEFNGERQNRSGNYAPKCGAVPKCSKVRISRDGEPFVSKTHFPYMAIGSLCGESRRINGHTCQYASAIMPVRNPIENYLAWERFAFCTLFDSASKHQPKNYQLIMFV